jgi:hypothetical protein
MMRYDKIQQVTDDTWFARQAPPCRFGLPRLRLHPEWGSDAHRPTTAIIGVDPAFRTGCKCALISLTGSLGSSQCTYGHKTGAISMCFM